VTTTHFFRHHSRLLLPLLSLLPLDIYCQPQPQPARRVHLHLARRTTLSLHLHRHLHKALHHLRRLLHTCISETFSFSLNRKRRHTRHSCYTSPVPSLLFVDNEHISELDPPHLTSLDDLDTFPRASAPHAIMSPFPLPSADLWARHVPANETVTKPKNINGLILESWAEGYMVGSLIILTCITLANMRRGVLLHKLIFLEVSRVRYQYLCAT
jgi:hypothetical protein